MMKMLVFQKTPVFFFHFPEKDMVIRQIFMLETDPIIFKRFQKVFFFFFKITFKINNKFLKSRHISGNSIIKNLNFPFGNNSYRCK